MSFVDDYFTSMLIGGLLISVFAWDRLKAPSYAQSEEGRVIELFAPPDLRCSAVYVRAFFAYTFVLIMAYVAACTILTVPILEFFGLLGEDTAKNAAANSLTAPLLIAAAVVGLAPTTPIFNQLEAKARRFAHHLSGIPTAPLTARDQLAHRDIDLEVAGAIALSEAGRERLALYIESAHANLGEETDFERAIKKVLAYKDWFVDGNAHLLRKRARPRIHQYHNACALEIHRLVLALDTLVALQQRDPASAEGVGGEETMNLPQSWRDYAQETKQIAERVCLLLVLYSEHSDLLAEGEGLTPKDEECLTALLRFTTLVQTHSDFDKVHLPLWTLVTFASFFTAVATGLILGNFEGTERTWMFSNGLNYGLQSLTTYSAAIFAGLVFYDHRYCRSRWPSAFKDDAVAWVTPGALVVLVAFAAAYVANILLNIHFAIVDADDGLTEVIKGKYDVLAAAAAMEAPRSLLGAVLCLLVVISIDIERADAPDVKRKRALLTVAVVGALLLFASGGLTRAIMIELGHLMSDNSTTVTPTFIQIVSGDDRVLIAAARVMAWGTILLLLTHRIMRHQLFRSDVDAGRNQPPPRNIVHV